jgi:hypothetical protein
MVSLRSEEDEDLFCRAMSMHGRDGFGPDSDTCPFGIDPFIERQFGPCVGALSIQDMDDMRRASANMKEYSPDSKEVWERLCMRDANRRFGTRSDRLKESCVHGISLGIFHDAPRYLLPPKNKTAQDTILAALADRKADYYRNAIAIHQASGPCQPGTKCDSFVDGWIEEQFGCCSEALDFDDYQAMQHASDDMGRADPRAAEAWKLLESRDSKRRSGTRAQRIREAKDSGKPPVFDVHPDQQRKASQAQLQNRKVAGLRGRKGASPTKPQTAGASTSTNLFSQVPPNVPANPFAQAPFSAPTVQEVTTQAAVNNADTATPDAGMAASSTTKAPTQQPAQPVSTASQSHAAAQIPVPSTPQPTNGTANGTSRSPVPPSTKKRTWAPDDNEYREDGVPILIPIPRVIAKPKRGRANEKGDQIKAQADNEAATVQDKDGNHQKLDPVLHPDFIRDYGMPVTPIQGERMMIATKEFRKLIALADAKLAADIEWKKAMDAIRDYRGSIQSQEKPAKSFSTDFLHRSVLKHWGAPRDEREHGLMLEAGRCCRVYEEIHGPHEAQMRVFVQCRKELQEVMAQKGEANGGGSQAKPAR